MINSFIYAFNQLNEKKLKKKGGKTLEDNSLIFIILVGLKK